MIASAFILLTIIVVAIILIGVNNIAKVAALPVNTTLRVALALGAWLFITAGLSLAGVFRVAGIPPRVPVLLVAPALIFTAFFFLSRRYKNFIQHIPLTWPVYFQVFRVAVELLLLGLAKQGRIPVAATFEGYNYDILIGLTSPIMGWLLANNKIGPLAIRLWNMAGFVTLAVVVIVFITHAYAPQLWHTNVNILQSGFGDFPYTWLAGFLMPVAVFMHVCSLVTIKKSR